MVDNEIIKSTQNPSVVRFAKLKNAKYRREESLFLCEGYKLAKEAIHSESARRLLVRTDVADRYSDLISLCKTDGIAVTLLAEAPFTKISTESAPQGIIALCETMCVSEYKYADGPVFVCSGMQDPGNLGTVIRSAAGFGYKSIVVHNCADVYNPKTVRSSMGGIFRTDLLCTCDLISTIADMRSRGRRVFACTLAEDSLILGGFEISPSDVFIVGNEGHGLDRDVIDSCDASVVIPMQNGVESFNAAVASCVIQWEQSKTFSKLSKGAVSNG